LNEKNEHALSDIDKSIMKILSNEHPKTVKQLITIVHKKKGVPKQKIFERISYLQDRGKIVLKDQLPLSFTFKDYLLSIHAYWYLLIVALGATTATLVLTNPHWNPIIGSVLPYARYLFGFIFTLFLPGYSFIKALFPVKEIDNVERASLSVGMSLAIVAMNALILNYTPWGISTTPITLSLLGITLALSTIALIREYQTLSKK